MRFEDTIEVNAARYNDLLESEQRLIALNAAGVDNWSGYDDAMDLYVEMKEQEQGL